MKRIKIRSDGTRDGTTVVDAETDEPFSHIMKVVWIMDPNIGIAHAIIYLGDFDLEVEGDAITLPA